MVRRRNVRAEDSDDEREGDGGDRSRRRDRASAVAKRRQTPSPPPANDPSATLDGGCEATNGAGSAGVGLSKEDFDAIPQDTREAIVASIDRAATSSLQKSSFDVSCCCNSPRIAMARPSLLRASSMRPRLLSARACPSSACAHLGCSGESAIE